MAKSKTRFDSPKKWLPERENIMREAVDGNYVRVSDYEVLLRAYKSALVQLDRAAERVSSLQPNSPMRIE